LGSPTRYSSFSSRRRCDGKVLGIEGLPFSSKMNKFYDYKSSYFTVAFLYFLRIRKSKRHICIDSKHENFSVVIDVQSRNTAFSKTTRFTIHAVLACSGCFSQSAALLTEKARVLVSYTRHFTMLRKIIHFESSYSRPIIFCDLSIIDTCECALANTKAVVAVGIIGTCSLKLVKRKSHLPRKTKPGGQPTGSITHALGITTTNN
jgi:hypothetical protein